MEELVSVIIPTFGRPKMLKTALESVLHQTYSNIQIIVVDDNDPDCRFRLETESILCDYKTVKYCKHEKNQGGCAARNTGIKNAKGIYVGFLDDDDEWLPNFVEDHLFLLKKSESIGAVYCNFYLKKKTNSSMLIKGVNTSRNKAGYVHEYLLKGWCPASTSLFLIRKETFCKVGNFDENLKSFQDYDMWLRISIYYKIDFCNNYLVIKNEHEENQISINTKTRQQGLDALKHKWIKELKGIEKSVFIRTIQNKQKQIYFNEIVKYRDSKQIKSAIMTFFKYLKTGKFELFNNLKLLWIIFLGYNIFLCYNHRKYKKLRI